MKRLLPTLFVLLCAGLAHAATPLPSGSLYQLAVPLTDQDGRAAPFAARRGTPQIVSMFYTSCTMVCPMIIDTMKATRRAAGEPAGLHLLAVSFDPERDSVEALRRYGATHRLDPHWWTLARTAPQDTRALAALLGVQYRRLPDGEFNHSSELVLLDGEGRIVARTGVIGRTDPQFVAAVRKATGG
jgi:protein SCO1/2